jgi:hypothetical protein
MTSDLHLQDGESDFQQARARAICLDAAIFVKKGEDRVSAVEKATAIFETQQEAQSDITGTVATLAEAKSPDTPEGRVEQVQINAIAKELQAKYFP